MQVVVDEYGAFIGKKEGRFRIKMKEKEEEYSAEQVSQILISSPASISSDAVELATEKQIDIVYLNHFGAPYARVSPCKFGGTVTTRRKQLEAYNDRRGAKLSLGFIKGKILNQIYFLGSLSKTREKIFEEEIRKLKEFWKKIESIDGDNIDKIRNEILGIEGFVASIYFECLSKIVPFKKRDREAGDAFNIFLNYGYGILYSEIGRAINIAGLDAYLGFLHTDRYGKPSLVLDLIEEFRSVVVDRAVVTLFVQKQVDDEKDFEVVEGKRVLSKEGRRKIIDAVLGRLTTAISYRGRKLSLKSIILEQARNIVRFLLEQKKRYEPFIYRW